MSISLSWRTMTTMECPSAATSPVLQGGIIDECNFEFEDDLFDIINRFIDDLNDGRSFEELDKKLFKDRLLEAIQRIQ